MSFLHAARSCGKNPRKITICVVTGHLKHFSKAKCLGQQNVLCTMLSLALLVLLPWQLLFVIPVVFWLLLMQFSLRFANAFDMAIQYEIST